MAIAAFTLAARLRAGETVLSGWCGLPYPIVAETIGRDGFPAVTLDSQHGLWDLAAILAAIAAVRQSGSAPIVRVPVGDFATVSRVLDFGAEGIIAPMINTAADARAFAAAAKFPPVGERSWGPHRAMTLAGLSDQSVYLREANDHIVTLAMIETRTALDESRRHRRRRRGSTGCSSVRPISRSRCPTASRSIRCRMTSSARSTASSPPRKGREKFPAPIATPPTARCSSPSAASASSR